VLQAQLRQIALVTAVAAFVMLTNLGGPRLWDRDEPRNAGCAREMLTRNDWVVPTFDGELRTHKPVLLYWCIMTSYLSLGVNEFAARLPSALCAIGSVICTYRMGRRLFGSQAGIWAAIALATSLMFVVAGRAATPDSLLIFCTTLALTIYLCGTFRPRFETTPLDAPPQLIVTGCYFPQHFPTVLALYAAVGLGVLAKGPVGLILPTAVIGMFLLIVRLPNRGDIIDSASLGDRLVRVIGPFEPLHFLKTCWSMRPFTAIFSATAVALPWYWAVGLATHGEFLRGFFLEHNLSRAAATMENHSGTIFFYPLAILVGFFPWSVFALPLALDTALQLRRPRHNLKLPTPYSPLPTPTSFHAGYLLSVCWIGVYVVLFSLARTKLPSYVTPCYPALALLVGNYIDRWSRQSAAVAGRWLLAAFACLALAGIGIAIAVPLAVKDILPGEEWLGLLGLVPIAGGIVCVAFALIRSYRAAAGSFAFAAITFATLLFAVALGRIDRHQTNHLLWQAIYARSRAPQVASYRILEPSWVFYGNRPVKEITVREITAAPPGGPRLAAEQAAHFLAQHSDAYLITTRQRLAELSPFLPTEVQVIAETPYFLKRNQELVVLSRHPDPTAALPHPIRHF
jgi:4-amino-4-deoxy-L-arabinose transferase-like glycosyltransferase